VLYINGNGNKIFKYINGNENKFKFVLKCNRHNDPLLRIKNYYI